VLIDGEPVPSCLVPVEDIDGRRVPTLETVSPAEGVGPVQQAVLDEDGFQGGYCTPGMVMVATALLEHDPTPSTDDIIDAIGGNICRCTGYQPIVRAIGAAAAARNATGAPTR
jgi:carbon-monoxide dehydrogenase small subunit